MYLDSNRAPAAFFDGQIGDTSAMCRPHSRMYFAKLCSFVSAFPTFEYLFIQLIQYIKYYVYTEYTLKNTRIYTYVYV